MNSNEDSDRCLNLERDLPVTPADVEALRRLRTEVPSWLTLTPEELEALIPPGALDRKPLAKDDWKPFSLD